MENNDSAINELAARITKLEASAQSSEKKPESFRDRLGREREERTEASDHEDMARRATNGSMSRITSPARRDELKRTQQELRSPVQAVAQRRAAAPSKSDGEAIEFYVWKSGELGTIKLLAQQGFSKL